MVIVVMGVAGSGKTTIGTLLAQRLHWKFEDADAFHSPENIEKMVRAEPLSDADRALWLQLLGRKIREWSTQRRDVVLACSALKESYRSILANGIADVRWVYLAGSRSLIANRLARRAGHFMPPSLLDSQFESLEVPSDAYTVDVAQSSETIVNDILRGLALNPLTS